MQKLAEVCVKRPVFAIVLILVLVVFGTVGFTRLGVDRLPEVENPTISISTGYPGASPEAIETEITEIIEANVNTIAGINELDSTSTEGNSRVTVSFNLDVDPDLATQEVRDKVNLAQRQLPDEIDAPIVRKQDPNSAPVVGYALSAPVGVKQLTEYATKVVQPQIESADGVGEVIVAGGQDRQINIIPDPFKLRGYGLSVNDLTKAIQEGNLEVPGGDVENGKQTLTLRTQGRITSLQGFERLIVKNDGNGSGSVRLSDVAQVEDGVADAERTAELNGKPTVLIYIRKQSGVNTLTTIEAIKARMNEAQKSFPAGYKAQVVRDQSQYIQAAVDAVEEHLVVGSILATLVVLIFLLNWRATIIAALSIPASIIATFGLMWAFGFTLNIITLLALTLAVGIVIDDAIVVIENIFRVMNAEGLDAEEAAVKGTREIGLAVLATTLSLIAVFLPVAFMQGLTGRLLSSFGITMSFAILVSLLVSFTLAPSLGARWLGRKPNEKARDGQSSHGAGPNDGHASGGKFFGAIDSAYTRLLEWTMAHRWVIVTACLLSLAAVPTLYKMAPFNFLPEDDESQFSVTARAPEGTSLEATTAIAHRMAAQIEKLPGVDYTLTSVNGFGQSSTNSAEVFVGLKDIGARNVSQNDVMESVRKKVLPKFKADDLRARVSPPQALRGFSGGGRGVQYVLTGPDLPVLKDAAAKMIEAAKKLPGAADADTDYVEGNPELQTDINRDAAADLGVKVSDAANALRFIVGGDKVSTYITGGYQYDVYLRAPKAYRADAGGISLWSVPSSFNGTANLDQVASFKKALGPTQISRVNRQRAITISVNTTPDASSADIVKGLDAAYKNLNLPPGYVGAPSGSSLEQAKAAQAFLLALVLSVVFMYLILAAQFESWIHPITILTSLPLTVPFALLSIVIFGQSLNIYSALGMLLLFGVVKKNAILQVDHTNQLRGRGMNRHDAIIQANRDRLRPILMTTLAFVAGMIPLVISTGTGAGTNRAIGTVIFGGQTLSLLLTLLATPVAYSLLDDAQQWFARVRGREKKAAKVEKVA